MELSPRSIERLSKVHPDLQRVVYRAVEMGDTDLMVIEGERTLEKQKTYMAKGASTTLRSRHVREMNECGEVCAVDLGVMIDGELRWDWPLYHKLAALMKEAARVEGIPIEAGADWVKFKDGPHFQLPWSKYP
jgi:peptidoglycan L-alanyl-D-glutamate endopeptidase CwlK